MAISNLETKLLLDIAMPIQGIDSLHKSLKFDLEVAMAVTNYQYFKEDKPDFSLLEDREVESNFHVNLYQRMPHSFILTYPIRGKTYDNIYHYYNPNDTASINVRDLVISELMIKKEYTEKVNLNVYDTWSALNKVILP